MPTSIAPGTDGLIPLAFAIHSGRGAYALLLGSGVSSAAEIKTGWEIVVDLIGKVAALSGAPASEDLEAWYRGQFGEEPDYSKLLERLAPTPSERRALLRCYFEPNEDERERGIKVPTEAHRAIARLVARGHVRVILTTNFDRLLESALAELGVQPYVIRSGADLGGMPSLPQVDCLIVKIHGDYIDERLKNTPDELIAYEPELDALLDRLFGDYGLVIAGWSAEWDGALRDAIARSSNRRFTTFWTTRRPLEGKAKDLAENRSASVLTIADADSFFTRVDEMVAALEDMNERPPATKQLAVAETKRYIANGAAGRIRLRDLIDRETQIARKASADMYTRKEESTLDEFEFRLRRVEAATATLSAIAATVGFWGEEEAVVAVADSIRELATFEQNVGGLTHLIELRLYPASLVFHAAALGAVAGRRYRTLATLAGVPTLEQGRRRPAATALTPDGLIDNQAIASLRKRADLPQSRTPAPDWVRGRIRDDTRDLLRGDEEFDRLYDRTECLLALLAAAGTGDAAPWFPMGGHIVRMRRLEVGALPDLTRELAELGGEWPPVKEGVFNSTNQAQALLEAYREQIQRSPIGLW